MARMALTIVMVAVFLCHAAGAFCSTKAPMVQAAALIQMCHMELGMAESV